MSIEMTSWSPRSCRAVATDEAKGQIPETNRWYRPASAAYLVLGIFPEYSDGGRRNLPPRSRPRAMSRSGVRIPSCSETRPKVGHVLGSVSRVQSRRGTGGIPTTSEADIGVCGPGEGEEAAESEEEAAEGLSRFRFSSLGDVALALHILVVVGPPMSPTERSAKRIEAVEVEAMRSRAKVLSTPMEWFVAVGSSFIIYINDAQQVSDRLMGV